MSIIILMNYLKIKKYKILDTLKKYSLNIKTWNYF